MSRPCFHGRRLPSFVRVLIGCGTHASPEPAPSMPTRWRSFATNLILLLVVTTLTLVVVDIVLISARLFPPVVDEGHPTVGWLGALPTGERENSVCVESASGSIVRFPRNEDGVRTAHPRAAFVDGGVGLRVAVGGDSHTGGIAATRRSGPDSLDSALCRRVHRAIFAHAPGAPISRSPRRNQPPAFKVQMALASFSRLPANSRQRCQARQIHSLDNPSHAVS